MAHKPTDHDYSLANLAFAARILLVLSLAAMSTSACATFSSQKPSEVLSTPPELRSWTYADLRMIDPIDAPSAEKELVAAYLRKGSGDKSSWWELRLDFLNMTMRNSTDIYIALDYAWGGTRQLPFAASSDLDWDTLIRLPASGGVNALDAQGSPIPELALLIQRDPTQAFLQVSLDGAALYPQPGRGVPVEIAAQVFVLSPGSNQLYDKSEPFRSSAPPPPPASLLLAFNNTYPAYTPAQALRRWDGAHTGPAGGRHGLSNLLRLARNHAIPLAVLDLKYPAWLSALDYAGDLNQVATMADSGTLILPEYLPEPVSVKGLPNYVQELSRRFDLPASEIGYAQNLPAFSTSEKLLFLSIQSDDPLSTIYRQADRRILPIPLPASSQPELQPDLNGLSAASRIQLVEAARQALLQPDTTPILVLGGDLTASSWGIPEVARAASGYIKNHPWIHPLNAYDLLSLPVSTGLPDLQSNYPDSSYLVANLPWDTMLSYAETDPSQAAALQSALALLPPATPADTGFAALQEIYASQVNVLLAASDWARTPAPAASCEVDLDLDGAQECLLASDHLYLVFEPELGALTHAFSLASDGPHQLIAPSSQFTFGTGDPSSWDLSADLAADPQVIPGAFYDEEGSYQVQVEPGQLTLMDNTNGLVKRFTLLPDGLRVDYHTETPLVVRLPLALDPWQRFDPGWGDLYQGVATENSWKWGIRQALDLQTGVQINVTTSGRLQVSAFNDTAERMGRVEDPNTEYLPGHYLPFPLALAEITGRGDFWIELRVSLK